VLIAATQSLSPAAAGWVKTLFLAVSAAQWLLPVVHTTITLQQNTQPL
jgi:hypothetical protein